MFADEKQQFGFNVQDLLGEFVLVSSVPICVVVSTGGGDGCVDGILVGGLLGTWNGEQDAPSATSVSVSATCSESLLLYVILITLPVPSSVTNNLPHLSNCTSTGRRSPPGHLAELPSCRNKSIGRAVGLPSLNGTNTTLKPVGGDLFQLP